MTAPHLHLADDATQADVLAAISEMNDDADGRPACSLQHPTPQQIDFDAALLAIDPDKDVDGLHPVNMGRLALGMPGPGVRARPAGIEALLAHYEIPVSGRGVCILGRGTTLGPARSPCCSRRSGRPPTRPSPSCTPACPTGPSTPGGPTS